MTIENSVKAVQVVALDMPPPVVMEETVSVKEVLRTIQKRRSGFALLCRKGRLSGIFTERDVLNKVIGKEGVLDRPVSELMTPDPVSVHENDSIGWAVLGTRISCTTWSSTLPSMCSTFLRIRTTCPTHPREAEDPMTDSPNQELELDGATILFCGDSGDGMQLTGSQFTTTSALFGNDVSTFPDFPSEIRAPAGSLAGVSAFQINFSSKSIYTPGDTPDALVAMNPAALKIYLPKLKPKGILILNRDAFSNTNLSKAGYETNPLEDPELANRYQLHALPMTTLLVNALEDVALNNREKQRCKNFFALPPLDRKQVLQGARCRRGEPASARDRVPIRRNRRVFCGELPRRQSFHRAGHVSHHQRKRGQRPGFCHRGAPGRKTSRLQLLPDHSRHRCAARAGQAEAPGCPDHPVRG